jgi:hypothetical protein
MEDENELISDRILDLGFGGLETADENLEFVLAQVIPLRLCRNKTSYASRQCAGKLLLLLESEG